MLSVVFGLCPPMFLVIGIFHPYGTICPIRGLVSVHLYELKEFVVIHPLYGLKKLHSSGMIYLACGLCIFTIHFYGLKKFHPSGITRPACVLCILTVHFYGLKKFSPVLDDPSSLWTLFIIRPFLWTLNFTRLGRSVQFVDFVY